MTDWKTQLSDDDVAARLLRPDRLYSANEAIRGGAPRLAGIYAWYFNSIPGGVDARRCHRHDGWTLLYCGISPKKPPTNGRPPSRSHIHQRLRTHFGGNAAGSTLRLTLGCLLEVEIGTVLRRVGTKGRLTFTNPGEQLLDRWLHTHARVAWAVVDCPWEAEKRILESGLPLPLNIDGNPCAGFTAPLAAVRRTARRRAEALPLIGDSGGPRRAPVTPP